MKLEKFRVTNFRSIKDSGWLNIEDVVAFIGENESGKTNALIPLWKLNPAVENTESKLDLIKDYPRQQYHNIDSADKNSELKKQRFIEARFSLDEHDQSELNGIIEKTLSVSSIELARDYNDELHLRLLNNNEEDVLDTETARIDSEIKHIIESIDNSEMKDKLSISFDAKRLEDMEAIISDEESDERLQSIKAKVNALKNFREVRAKLPQVRRILPKFIYYSTYENLDSEIFLSDVLADNPLYRKQRRTINTLFQFVKLSPKQISELGETYRSNLSEDEKRRILEDTKKRQILLESASDDFTKKFNNWWQQETEYKFKFEADGHSFRIKVADNIRPTSLELSSRSSGLQWFFSFFLVFLVESQGLHKNAILLLDEPGVTLHPNAQKQLYLFFDNLAKTNQLLYTTHSPFMINSNHLDKVYAVYVNEEGDTCVSSDLRASSKDKKRGNSIYPAHAALGLSVSDTLLHGCYPVIVEGISDQIYFSLIKNSLIKNGKLPTQKEMVFIPSNGVKGIKAVLQILSGLQNEEYPYVLVDGDEAGKALQKSLTTKGGLYCGKENRVLSLAKLFDGAETEDLMPHKEMSSTVNSYIPKTSDCDDTFDDIVDSTKPICDQIKKYTNENSIELSDGYKVEIAEQFKRRTNSKNWDLYNLMSDEQKQMAETIFQGILK